MVFSKVGRAGGFFVALVTGVNFGNFEFGKILDFFPPASRRPCPAPGAARARPPELPVPSPEETINNFGIEL